MKPQTRNNEELLVRRVGDELVIYDLSSDRGHALNPTAAFVFQQCDGQTSIDQIAARMATELNIPHTRQVTDLALTRLRQADLLVEAPTTTAGLSRREVLKLAGRAGVAAAMLPVVTTLLVPSAAQAQSAVVPDDCQSCWDEYARCLATNCPDFEGEVESCPGYQGCRDNLQQCLDGCQ